jgi:esterase/lipase/1-acyl-sn-glycerol-3-phosphate acyltransferase
MMANSITFSGEENLDKNFPSLFVSNHFTRIETFLIPYVLYKKLNYKARSLADHSIFKGVLGDYMNAVGTISTKDEHRNEKIIGDLITGRINWIIYPEGAMIKSKKVTLSDDTFVIENKNGLNNIFTGSAILALQSEMEKTRYIDAQNSGDIETIREFKKKYFFNDCDEISYHNTHIIPVNMSYFPIRKGDNKLAEFASKYIDSSIESINEEIDIESNLLLNSQLHIHFSKPIDVKDYLLDTKRKLKKEGVEFDNSTILEKQRVNLTNLMMNEVYKNILITFDHLFALCLEYLGETIFTLDELKARMFIVYRELKTLGTYRLDSELTLNFYKLLNDEPHELFDDVFSLATEQNILELLDDQSYRVNIDNFKNEHTFFTIRVKNTLRVLLNETIILHELHTTTKKQLQKSSEQINREIFYIIHNNDKKSFKYDYNKYYSVFHFKEKEIGRPFILFDKKNSVGCVISHGYKSAPKEIEPLAKYLFAHGINVYAIRIKGHGTMPEDLRDTSYTDWYDSFDIGYSALKGVSKKLYLCGFSTGGLLSLLKASNVKNKIDGIICINSAVSLQDIRVKYMVPTINVLNNFLSIFSADIDSYESEPEHPEINYKITYLTSVGELKKLIDLVNERLIHITDPMLIIQADNDPVVDPKSADIIYNSILSSKKEKYLVKSEKHVITLQESINSDFFEKIVQFIED